MKRSHILSRRGHSPYLELKKRGLQEKELERKVQFNGDDCWKLWQDKNVAVTEKLGDSFLCLINERELHDVTIDAIQKKMISCA